MKRKLLLVLLVLTMTLCCMFAVTGCGLFGGNDDDPPSPPPVDQPSDPSDPSDPSNPVDPSDPTEPETPDEPNNPSDPGGDTEQRSFVGTYKFESMTMGGVTIIAGDSSGLTEDYIVIILNNDGTVSHTSLDVTQNGTWTEDNNSVTIYLDGVSKTFLVDGNKLTMSEGEGTIILSKYDTSSDPSDSETPDEPSNPSTPSNPSEPTEPSEPDDTPGHTHEYTSVVTAPTCTEQGYTTYTCDCGDSYKGGFTSALGHSYKNRVCERCKDTLLFSQGLKYTSINNDTEYEVSGIGTCTETDIVIPSTYNNLPVTSIGKRAFRNCTNLTSITIPDSITTIGVNGFSNCKNLKKVNYIGTVDDWVMIKFEDGLANPLYYAKHLYLYNTGSKEFEEVVEVNLITASYISKNAFA